MTPREGTLERIMLDKIEENYYLPGCILTHFDFMGTGITHENFAQVHKNLQTGMFESEQDEELKKYAH